MKRIRLLSPWLPALLALPPALAAPPQYLVYFGTYTAQQKSKGIHVARFDAATGKLTAPELAAETVNPSFVAVHPNRKFLYAVSEMGGAAGQKGGAVSAFSLDLNTGKLTFLNRVSTRGAGPCYVRVDKTGKCLLVSNYGSGSVAALPVGKDGRLGEATAFHQHAGSSVDPKRQSGPHAHSINPSPDNRYALVADLGLDQVLVYRMNPAKGTLAPNDPPFGKVKPGGGPRHLAFHPNGRYVYVNNEMGSAVTAFSWEAARGVLTEIETLPTLPKDFKGVNHTAETQVHPSGKFVYVSNRGHDSIAVFAVNPATGALTPVEQASTRGKIPRNFTIDPSGAWLIAANQNSHNVVVFRIDPATGRLTPTGQEFEVGAPVCVKFVRAR